MAKLPNVGDPAWGDTLNQFLLVSHNTDGTVKPASINSLAAGTVGLNDLRTTNLPGDPIKNLFLTNDGTDLVWRKGLQINVKDFGAIGDGVTDDTDAVQAAVNSATQGGGITFPRGTYMVRTININYNGIQLVGGSRWGTRITRISGNLPLIDISGVSSVNGHIRYCGLFGITISGNNMPGILLRSYYADTAVYRDVSFIHCPSLTTDFVEVWDTRLYDCSWEDSGSGSDPVMLIRNSTESGTFGFSNDNSNQIHFLGCRWEGFHNGAIRLDGAVNGSTSLLNGVFFVSCKMESSVIAGTPFQIMNGTTLVFVTQIYIAIMAPDIGFVTPIDAITDYGSQVFMTDIYVHWGVPMAGLANSALHVWAGSPHMYHKLSTFFVSGSPNTSVVIAEPGSDVSVARIWNNVGIRTVGNVHSTTDGSPQDGYKFKLDNTGKFQVISILSGLDMVTIDNNATRAAFEIVNGVDTVGFSDNYITEKWRLNGLTGSARFAGGKFQIEATKGYVAINATPFTNIAMLVKAAVEGDRGIVVVRPTSTATNRLMEFQDETFNIQGMAIDSNGRPIAVGTPPHVAPGTLATYANPRDQVRDIAGGIILAIQPSPTAPGSLATVTFSRAYAAVPLSIILSDQSNIVNSDLYVSDRSATSFTVSTRSIPRGGTIVNFDYVVVA